MGILRPNSKAKRMNDYIVNSFENKDANKLGLFDGEISYTSEDSKGFYWYNTNNYLDITVNKKCALWCLSGGEYEKFNSKLDILKWNGHSFEESGIKENIRSDKKNTWTKTIDVLPKGRYKFVYDTNYRFDSEWFFEDLQKSKYILKQDNKYYTIKEEFYKNNSFKNIEIDKTSKEIYKQYGFNDLSDLFKKMTINTESFRPIDKFDKNKPIEILKFIEK